jgi:hypothetical protein
MENIFLSAMDIDSVRIINETRANKEFCLQLISDLDKVFITNNSIFNQENNVEVRMKVSPDYNWHNCYGFIAKSEGVKFYATLLTYKKYVVEFLDKYNYKSYDGSDHATYTIEINLKRNDLDLAIKLKDIVKLMELKRFYKRF